MFLLHPAPSQRCFCDLHRILVLRKLGRHGLSNESMLSHLTIITVITIVTTMIVIIISIMITVTIIIIITTIISITIGTTIRFVALTSSPAKTCISSCLAL